MKHQLMACMAAVLSVLFACDALAARTFWVSEKTDASLTFAFGDPDGMDYSLFLAYGSTDAGEDKAAWDGFVKVGEIPHDSASFSYDVPEAYRDGRFLRFFLMQTEKLPYEREYRSIRSTGAQWIDIGVAPTDKWLIDARFGDVVAKKDGSLFGAKFAGKQYLLVMQDNPLVFKFYDNGKSLGVAPERGKDYRLVIDPASTAVLRYDGGEKRIGISRSVSSPGNFAIFGDNGGGHLAEYTFYRMKIANDYTPIRDLVPVSTVDGKIGLYDQIGNVFHPNKTETPFILGDRLPAARKGRVIHTIPSFRFNRSVKVANIAPDAVTLAFGNPDGKACRLFVAHGAVDAGDDRHAWASFDEVATVTAGQKEFTYEIPETLKSGSRVARFFLVRTEDLPYAKELASVTSSGSQLVRLDYIPGNRTSTDFRFGNVTYKHQSALFGQHWSGNSYLFNMQSDSYRFHGNGNWTSSTFSNDGRCRIVSDIASDDLFILDDGPSSFITKESLKTFPLVELCVFATHSAGNPSSFAFRSMLVKDGELPVRNLVPVETHEGDGALFDRANGTICKNVGSSALAKGEARPRQGWTLAATEPLIISEDGCSGTMLPSTIVLTEDTDLSSGLDLVKDGTVFDLAGRKLTITADTAFSDRSVSFTGKSGVLRIEVPANETYTLGTNIERDFGSIDIEKGGEGTLVIGRHLTNVGTVTIEKGLMKYSANAIVPSGVKVKVLPGAAVDFNGQRDNCASYDIAGTGPDGLGALRNTGADIGKTTAQMAGISLSADATLYGTGDWGIINSGYNASFLDLNGHTLTLNNRDGKKFWLANTSSSQPGTFVVKSGEVYLRNQKASIQLREVDFIFDGQYASLFQEGSTYDYLGDVTLLDGGSLKEQEQMTNVRNLYVYDGGLVPNTSVKWIHCSDTVLVSNETTDVVIYPPFTESESKYPRLVKKGAGTLTIANNHTENRLDNGVEIFGGTVVMSSSRTSGAAPGKAISSQSVNVTIHDGGTLDMRQCKSEEFKVKTLRIDEGGTLLHTSENVIRFTSDGVTFDRPGPFAFTGNIKFAGNATFDLSALYASDSPPVSGTSLTLLSAGSISCDGSVLVTGCPHDYYIVNDGKSIVMKTIPEQVLALKPIKIWTVGGDMVYGNSETAFRVILAEALAREGWNVRMTGYRSAHALGAAATMPAWKGHTGIEKHALKTSATRAGLLEGLESYAMAAEEPDFTVLACGEADVADGVADETVLANFKSAVTRIKASLPMTTVLAATIPGGSAALNSAIAEWCAGQTDVECVDLASVMMAGLSSAEHASAAALLKTKLLSLATPGGKKTPSSWTRPSVTRGAENNVPAAYLRGFTRVRTVEPSSTEGFAQNIHAMPFTYAPAMKEVGIEKVGYYIELVHKETGALRALWVDMDAPGETWADVALPVTPAQCKKRAVTKLHVWSNSSAVSAVPADDDSVHGFIEFGANNYNGTEQNPEGGIAEPWSAAYGFDDTLITSGTSGHACFQIMRKFSDASAFPAGEILFAYAKWGAGQSGYRALGIGTLADYGYNGYTTSKSLDWTFAYGNEGSDVNKISAGAYSAIKIDFWVKYAQAPSRAEMADCIWTGEAGNGFADPANWKVDQETAATSLADSALMLPQGSSASFSYVGYDPVNLKTTSFMLDGSATFPDVGGFYLSSLDMGSTGRLTFDPTKFSIRLVTAPTFAPGAKIALDKAFASNTKGRFLLMTWDKGMPELSAESLDALFDASSASGKDVKVWAEALESGGGRLWLDLDRSGVRPRINVLCVGDSITQGSDSSYGNWRIFLMKKLSAAGYEPIAKGHWKVHSNDICGAAMPPEWIYHSGISGQRLVTKNGGGTIDAIENMLDRAGDVDFVLVKLGTNDINSNGSTAEELYPVWEKLVWKVLNQKPRAKFVAGAVVDIAYNEARNREVLAFNAKMLEATSNGTFPAGRTFFADLYTPCYRYDSEGQFIKGSFQSATDLHPDWPGENKMADTYLQAILNALSADADFVTGESETVTETASGIENNVPAEYLRGYTRARVLDIAANTKRNLATLGYVPYSFVDPDAPAENIARVGYYIELKRRNDFLSDYHGLVRYLWVSMDAFGNRTIDDVAVPLNSVNQTLVERLIVRTNMPGIESTPADGSNDRGWVEFWPGTYNTDKSSSPDAPAHTYGCDWNDIFNNNTSGFGSMQVHRLTPGEANPAQVLFSFNHWTGANYWEIGLGNFSHQGLNSIDWTWTGEPGKNMYETMSSFAYEVARIEIWTSAADGSRPVSPAIYIESVSSSGDDIIVKGNLSTLGNGSASADVKVEWSKSADFAVVEGSQNVGTFTEPSAVSATVSGLAANEKWYFRFTATDANANTSATVVSDPYERINAFWRPTAVTDVWTSAAWLKDGAGTPVVLQRGWSARIDGAEKVKFDTIRVDEAVESRQVVVESSSDYTLAGTGNIKSDRLVKDGDGTLVLDGAVLAGTPDIEVRKGVVKLSDTAVEGAAGSQGGTITVKNGAQFDLNFYDEEAGGNRPRANITGKKKFVIEGAGPDGKGAIVSSRACINWNSAFDEIELAGDATIGGSARIEVRNNAKNIIHGPEDATLTVKVDTGSENYYDGLGINGTLDVGKVVIAPEGRIKFEGSAFKIDVPRGFDLYGKFWFWNGSGTWNCGPVTALGDNPMIGNSSSSATFGAPLTVPTGVRLSLGGGNTVNYVNTVTNGGVIAQIGGVHNISGPLVNENNPLISFSANTQKFFPTTVTGDSRMEITGGRVDLAGTTLWGDNALNIKMSGKSDLVLGQNDTEYGYPEFLEGKLTVDMTGEHSGTVYYYSGKSSSIYGPVFTGLVNNFFAQGRKDSVIESISTNLSVEAKVFNAGTQHGYGEHTFTGSATSIGATTLTVDSGSNRDYSGNMKVLDGVLRIGSGGLTTTWRQPMRPLFNMQGGTLKAAESFAITQPGMTAMFGDLDSGSSVEVDLNDKTVTWATGLTGQSDVTIKGPGEFVTGRPGIQGIPRGKWTVDSEGTVDLKNAAGFAGGLKLGENASATLDIAGESMVELVFWTWYSNAWDIMKNHTAKDNIRTPHVATSLTYLNRTKSQIRDVKRSNGTGINYLGQFYVSTGNAGTWTFNHRCPTHSGIMIDGTSLSQAGVNGEATVSIDLAEGWHDFMISAYTDKENPQVGPYSGEDTFRFKVNNGDYAVFDSTTVPMRLRQGEKSRTTVRFRQFTANEKSAALYLDADESKYPVGTDVVTNSMRFINAYYSTGAASPLGCKAIRLDGYFLVGRNQAGAWSFSGGYDDRIALEIDGNLLFATTSASETKTVSVALTEGWHKFTVRTADSSAATATNTGSGGKLTDTAGNVCSLKFKPQGSSSYYAFDERHIPIVFSAFDAQKFEKPGLGGAVELSSGSVLVNNPRKGGWCPIYGTLKGAGTLQGPFRFTGDDNLWEISGSAARSLPENTVSFVEPDANALAGLKRLKVVFDHKPGRPAYIISDALGLTEESVSDVIFDVFDAKGEEFTDGCSLAVENGKLVIRNSHTTGFYIKVR